MKLLDTTVAVDHLRGDRRATALIEEILERGEPLGASELVRFELLVGVRGEEAPALERFFDAPLWIPVTEHVARTAGALARRYRAAYPGIDDVDYLIAATSVVADAELLTTNTRHFPMLGDLRPAY